MDHDIIMMYKDDEWILKNVFDFEGEYQSKVIVTSYIDFYNAMSYPYSWHCKFIILNLI